MIIFKHKDLPKMKCHLESGVVIMDINGDIYESSFKKLDDENQIESYLNKIFQLNDQVNALNYCLNNSKK